MVACTPHPGLGAVSVRRGALVRHVDLATCRTWTTKPPVAFPTLSVATSRLGSRGTQTIVDKGKAVYAVRERYDRIPGGSPGPIDLYGTSPDGKWVLFAVDPQNSASLAADGLTLQAVSVAGGRPRVVATGLLAADYRAWCDGKLVLTAGGDRITTHHKWLVVTGPPDWQARILLREPHRAFASLACGGTSVVVQAARATGLNESILHAHWSLWRVRLSDGRPTVLDTPPPGWSDDSPRAATDGRIVYVRTHGDHGVLYSLGGGPLLDLGNLPAYFGHRSWPFSWSLQR